MRLLCVLSAFSVFRALNTMISSRVLPFLLPPFFPRAAFYRPARPTIFAPHAVASNAPGVCARLRDCIHRARREKTSSDVAACLTVSHGMGGEFVNVNDLAVARRYRIKLSNS